MVYLCACVPELRKCTSHVLVPNMAALPHAIYALFEFENMPFRDFKTRRWLHVKVLLEVGVEVCCLDIHLMEFKVMLCHKGKNGLEG
jgi:hypothetical protein